MLKRKVVIGFLVLLLFLPSPLFAKEYRDTNRFVSGFWRIFMAPFRLPFYMVKGTIYGPPIVGTAQGVVVGTFSTVTDLVGGIFDMAAAAAPYAKYAIFFV